MSFKEFADFIRSECGISRKKSMTPELTRRLSLRSHTLMSASQIPH